MPRFTRHHKKIKKNKTFKRGGAADLSQTQKLKSSQNSVLDDKKGIFDIFGEKLSGLASSTIKTAADSGLKIIGLERIDKSNDSDKIDQNVEKLGDAASGIISDIKNVADKASAALIGNINEVLASPAVNQSVTEAAEETAEITGKLAENFNEALDNPIVKQELEEAIENAGEIGSVVVEAAKEPFNKAVDIAAEAVPKATGAAVSGAVKVGTDAMAAIPGVGGIIEIGKIINDSSKAASSIVEAGTEAVEAASDVFIDTKQNIEKGLKELEEKKKMAEQISSRTTNSINQFENPLSNIKTTGLTGGRKTKRRLLKRKLKSKRVRFAI